MFINHEYFSATYDFMIHFFITINNFNQNIGLYLNRNQILKTKKFIINFSTGFRMTFFPFILRFKYFIN